ncbi:DUF2470 domain-containing protein [Streptomyces sp. NPDC002004]
MGVRYDGTTAPSAAERARSVLAAAWSCTVTTEDREEHLIGAHTVTPDGGLLFHLPEDSRAMEAASTAPAGDPTALLEFTDVAPVPVCDRVRARLWLSGHFVATGPHVAFRPARAALHDATERICIGYAEFAEATADPFVRAEARLLTHLAGAHPDAVELLTRCVDPDRLQGVVRVQPLALDRYGITLRLERLRGFGDVRLPFHAPADDMTEISERMHTLLEAARATGRRRSVRHWAHRAHDTR